MGPFKAILVSKWSQMGRVEADWINAAGGFRQSVLSWPSVHGLRPLTGFILGGGGGGGVDDKGIWGWGANVTGGERPPFIMGGRGIAGGGFLGRGLVGFLCKGGPGLGGALIETGLES